MDKEEVMLAFRNNRRLKTLNTAFDNIRRVVSELDYQNSALLEQLRTYSETEEIQKRDKLIDDMRRRALYIMSENEYEDDKGFRNYHYRLHNNGKSKSGGNTYIYELSGTGIGTCIKIKCPICGQEADITDYGSW